MANHLIRFKKQVIELSRKKYATPLEEFQKIEEEKEREQEQERENLNKEKAKDISDKATSSVQEKIVNNEEKQKQEKDEDEGGSPLI